VSVMPKRSKRATDSKSALIVFMAVSSILENRCSTD
jgi:hypothetical protein